MSVREVLNGKKSTGIMVGATLIVIAGVFIVLQIREFSPSMKGKAFYSIDDGKTYFLDDMMKLAPFKSEGKEAVRVHLFKCGGEKKIGFLSRLTPEALALTEEVKKARSTGKPPANVGALATIGTTGTEVKKPGDPAWTSMANASKATPIRLYKCPDGRPAEEIEPE